MGKQVSTKEIAEQLNCHPATVRRMARKGQIPAIRLPGAWRIDPAEVILALSRDGTGPKDGGP